QPASQSPAILWTTTISSSSDEATARRSSSRLEPVLDPGRRRPDVRPCEPNSCACESVPDLRRRWQKPRCPKIPPQQRGTSGPRLVLPWQCSSVDRCGFKHVAREMNAGHLQSFGKFWPHARGEKFSQNFAVFAYAALAKNEDVLHGHNVSFHASEFSDADHLT